MSVSNILPSVASDWNVLFSFYRILTDDSISDSFLQDQKFLKFRSLFMRSLAAAVNLSEDTHPTRLASWLETLDFALSYEMVAEMQFSVVNLTHEVGTLIGGKGLCQCIGKLQWTTASFDFHQMAVHKRTTMLAHCNLKQNLCSKQSSFFPFMHCPLVANWKTRRSI